MRRIGLLLVLASVPGVNADVINLDASRHAIGDSVRSPLVLDLEPGNWLVSPVAAEFEAFSPWISNLGCDIRCVPKDPADRGFLHRWGANASGLPIVLPEDTWDGFAYGTAGAALKNAATLAFSLVEQSSVEFYLPTGVPLNDNRGGISLEVVKLPSTLIDFEEFELEGPFVAQIDGALFSDTHLIIPGNPRTGFNGNSNGRGNGSLDDAGTGNSIAATAVTTDDGVVADGKGVVQFEYPIFDLSFDLLDIESNILGESEIFTARVYDQFEGGEPLNVIRVDGFDIGIDGDGGVLSFSFNGTQHIRRLEFEKSRTDGTTNPESPGYALDNLSFATAHVDGDFDYDGRLTIADLDILSQSIRDAKSDPIFDVDKNQSLGITDLELWVTELKDTEFGDANLDGVFDSTDLVLVFQPGEYEDDVAGNSSWREGDFSGNGDFGTDDLILAFQQGTYVRQPVVRPVPEPQTLILIWIAGLYVHSRSVVRRRL